MSQNIQLQQVMVNGVIIKMGSDDICVGIIGRMLHRSKGINVFPVRQDDDPSRMLSGTPADSRTSLDDPVNLTVPLSLTPFLIIILHIAKCRLVRQSGDGPCPEGLSGTKDHLCILVGAALIVPGKSSGRYPVLYSL